MSLGDSIVGALERLDLAFGPETSALVTVAALHVRTGGNAAESFDVLARDIRRRAGFRARGAAAASGVRLSGRVVAGLPLLLVPLMPMAHGALLDPITLMLVAVGTALALGGLLWIDKLVPYPPADPDAAAILANLAAASLRAGVSVDATFEFACAHASEGIAMSLMRARRLARLGCRWSDALQRSGDPRLASIGATLRQADAYGIPIADALERHAREAEEEAARAFEASLSRAPVLMVVPLTVLVLPSFFLLGVAPFLRELARGW